MVGRMKILRWKRRYRYPISLTDVCLLRDYPHCIDLWTKDHVKSFIINENLNSLLPVIVNMNGRVLHEMYTMCKANRNSMFQTMKDEVAADGQHKTSHSRYLPLFPRRNSKIHSSCVRW
jgi:hypothetical protein